MRILLFPGITLFPKPLDLARRIMKAMLFLKLILSLVPLKAMSEKVRNQSEVPSVSNKMDDQRFTIDVVDVLETKSTPQRKVLDGSVIPKHYDLIMDVRENGFGGKVGIEISIKKETTSITLNSNGLEVKNVKLRIDGSEHIPRISLIEETLVLVFESSVDSTDEGYLEIEFDGKYNEDLTGFYKSDYSGKPIYSTHFEPTDARKVFPCFDQPDMKATFSISISADADAVVLSNSSLRETKGKTRYFNKTEKMSTYLVAFVIGNLEYIEAKTNRGIPIRVYAHKDEVSWGQFALDVAKNCVDHFETYFGVEYSFPKIDMVAIPAFAMGAMENWGLITYRKTALLYNKAKSPVGTKKIVAEVVCHELAHMWFGNLVTMEWWDDLWLNEGFATWAASMGVYNLPKDLIDWDVWTSFVNSDVEAGMSHDALHSTHPIAVPVTDPNGINQIFDSISYSKGASLIRMIESHIGHEQFRDGVRSYLKEFQYSNANTSDLWRHISGSTELAHLVDNWINKEGFPLIRVEEKGENKLVISQERFFLGDKEEGQTWVVPIKINFFGEGVDTFELSERSMEIERRSTMYKLNEGSSGFYRVIYPEESLNNLLNADLSEINRLNLVNDVFALAFGSYQSIKERLGLVVNYKHERNYEVFYSVVYSLLNIASIFYDDKDVLPYIRGIIKELVSERARKVDLGNSGSTINDIALNSLLVAVAIKCSDEIVVKELESVWSEYRKDENTVSPDFRAALHIVVVDNNFDDILRLYKEGKTPEAKRIAISALTQTKKTDNINFILNNITMFDAQDGHSLFNGLIMNYKFRNRVIEFVLENFDLLCEHYKNISIINYVIEISLGSASSPDMVKRVEEFLSTPKCSGSDKIIEKVREKIRINARFRSENKDLHLTK